MLRNCRPAPCRHQGSFLNEVLSLNAQESWGGSVAVPLAVFLNEVLSLNAQEWENGRFTYV